MHAAAGDTPAESALARLIASLRRNAVDITFRTGEYWFIDNYRVAHGRGTFTPRYDGADRWLKRLYITESLRHSAQFRVTPTSRIIMLPQSAPG